MNCLILGDFIAFNIDWINNICMPGADLFAGELVNICHELQMHQHVQQYTRMMQYQTSILDLILSTSETDVGDLSYHIPLGKSDQLVLTIKWQRDVPKAAP